MGRASGEERWEGLGAGEGRHKPRGQGGLVAKDSGRKCQKESKNCSGTGESQKIQTKLLNNA